MPITDAFIILGIMLSYVDESVRKVYPNNPLIITSIKDILFVVAGLFSFKPLMRSGISLFLYYGLFLGLYTLLCQHYMFIAFMNLPFIC